MTDDYTNDILSKDEVDKSTMSDQQTEIPLYQYSIKIERSAKGARWTIHVHTTTKEQALDEAVRLYDDVGKRLEVQGLTAAPVEKGRTE